MKKIVMFLLMGLLMIPSGVYSRKYYRQSRTKVNMPTRIPNLYDISVFVDFETGDLVITSANDVIGLNINITGNGVTYLNTTVSLISGDSYTDCLDYLPVGTYLLTLSTPWGVVDQYEISVEDDE